MLSLTTVRQEFIFIFSHRSANAGDAVVNLRENVIRIRLEYSVASMDDKNREAVLDRALRSVSLEDEMAIGG